MDSSNSPTTKFVLLNPTKEKIIVFLFDSLAIMLIFLIIPSLGFQSAFLSKELSRQIISLISSLFFSFVVYYPFACGLVYFFRIITGKERIRIQNLIIALLFIIIFNIVTFSFVSTYIIKNIQVNAPSVNVVIDPNTKEKLCGLQIVEVTAPSAKNAGLLVGEVIKTINDYPVSDMNGLNHALEHKKPDDTVIVITNTNTHNVTLFSNPQNPQQILMGVKVNPTECGK